MFPAFTPPATPPYVPGAICPAPLSTVKFVPKAPVNTRHPLIWPKLVPAQIDAFLAKRQKRLNQHQNPVAVEEFEYKVRRIISDYLTPPKNEYKLNRVLWWMDRFRHELDEMVFVRDQHDLFKTFEVENIIQCAALSATASLERTESRWLPWHFRSDFPEKDDANWLQTHRPHQGRGPGDEINISTKTSSRWRTEGDAACA